MAHSDACLVVPCRVCRDELLERMLECLAGSGRLQIDDISTALVEIVRREESASTAFGLGVALPHCFLGGVGGPHLAIACVPEGLDFGGPDGELTHVVFLLVEDLAARAAHTTIISRLARLCRETALVCRLRQAREAGAVAAVLAEEEAALD